MATYVSPGVYVTEKDWSDYTPSLNATTVGVVGFASQGPVGVPTLVTTQDQLISKFGSPESAIGGYGLLGSYHILERTSTLYFTRAALDDAQRAWVEVPIGTCPYVELDNLNPNKHYLIGLTIKDGGGNLETNAPVWVYAEPASGLDSLSVEDSQAEAIADAIGVMTDSSSPFDANFKPDSPSSLEIVGTYAGENARLEVRAWEWSSVLPTIPAGTTFGSVTALSGQAECLSSVGGYAQSGSNLDVIRNGGKGTWFTYNADETGASGISSGIVIDTSSASGGAYINMSLYPGAGYNYASTMTQYGVKTDGLQTVISSNQGANQSWSLLKNGGVEETFPINLIDNLDSSANGLNPERFINKTTDETNKTSDYVFAEFAYNSASAGIEPASLDWGLPDAWGNALNGEDVSAVRISGAYVDASAVKYSKLVDGVYSFTSGLNGDMAGGKSFSDSDVKAAIMGSAQYQDGVQGFLKEDVDVNMVAIPGCTDQSIQNDLITNAETSQKFLSVINPPQNLGSAQEAIRWSNGKASGRTAAINSSYTSVYWPWVKLFNPFSRQDEYVSPDIFAVRQMCYTDTVGEPWFAPAGLTRGRLTRPIDVEMVLSQGDRDALYGPGNVINPITKFSTDGIVIWGQRTAQRAPTALDRVNVRRLMILIRKTILASTKKFVFEPNDPATWSRVTNSVAPFLADIQNRRGITKFKVICDETTNTPLRIDRNELWCKVIIQPTKAAEILVFELNLTSASLGMNVPNA